MDASTMQSSKAEVLSATSAFGLYVELPFKDVLGDEGDVDGFSTLKLKNYPFLPQGSLYWKNWIHSCCCG